MKFIPKIFQEDKYHYLSLLIYTIGFPILLIFHQLDFNVHIISNILLFIIYGLLIFSVFKNQSKKIKIASLLIISCILTVYTRIQFLNNPSCGDYMVSCFWKPNFLFYIPMGYFILYVLLKSYKSIDKPTVKIITKESIPENKAKLPTLVKKIFLINLMIPFLYIFVLLILLFINLEYFSKPAPNMFVQSTIFYIVFFNIIVFILNAILSIISVIKHGKPIFLMFLNLILGFVIFTILFTIVPHMYGT